MGADQDGTLAALRQLRAEVFVPIVACRRGKVVKSMGDGWLVEFSSAEDAAICAMQLQDRLAGHPMIKLRIGVHVGDVVHEGEDVFGDGINIASRLEALAEPGAVAVSDAVHSALDGTLRPSFDDQGQRSLKNIDRTVRVWTRGGAVAGTSQRLNGNAITLLDIVPVATTDQRDEVRELADALTSDLYNHLGHMRFIRTRITETPSSEAYVLCATLRARGNKLRLEARLSAEGDDQHWSRKFDGDLEKSFEWQDETALEAAGHFNGVITDEEMRRLAEKPIEALSAPEAVAAASMSRARKPTENSGYIIRLNEHAIAGSPDWAPAYAEAIMTYLIGSSAGRLDLFGGWNDRIDGWRNRATELAHDDPQIDLSLAILDHFRVVDPDKMREVLMNTLRQTPFDPSNLMFCGMGFLFLGEPESALPCIDNSLKFTHPSRQSPIMLSGRGLAAVQLGHCEDAVGHARRAISFSADWLPAWRVIVASAGHLGMKDEAREALAKIEQLHPGETVSAVRRRSRFVENEYTRRYFDGLRLAGMPL